jgi:hypothetical protein
MEFIIGTVLSIIGIIAGIIIYYKQKPPRITIEQIISEIVDHLMEKVIIKNEENVQVKKFLPSMSRICNKYKMPLTEITINNIVDELIYRYQNTPFHSKTEVTDKILSRLYDLNEEISSGASQSEEKDDSEIIINQGKLPKSQSKSYADFFQGILDELREEYAFTKAKVGLDQSWYLFPSGVRGYSYGAAFVLGGKVRVKLHIDTGKKDTNKQIFNTLLSQKESIEQQFGEKLTWEEFPDNRQSTVSIYKVGTIRDDAKSLEDTQKWMITKLLKMKEVFNDRLQKTRPIYPVVEKKPKVTVYQCLENVYNKLEADKEYTVEDIKDYLSKEYKEQALEELNKITRDFYVVSAIVNEKNKPHWSTVPFDKRKSCFYYPDENDNKKVKKFHPDIKDNPTIYWKENGQKTSEKFLELK